MLVFTRTKLAASRLASWLDRAGIDAVAIHSDRSQPERTRALEEFKTGEIRVLVATDVAARGLDIEDLPHVVNFELPWNPQDYIHRIGRTGRAGQMGDAISLVCIDETDLLRGVQRLLRKAIPWTVEDGFIPDRNTVPRPLRGGLDAGSGGGSGAAPADISRPHHSRPSEAASGGLGAGGAQANVPPKPRLAYLPPARSRRPASACRKSGIAPATLGRGRAGQDHLGAREVEAQHQVGRDAVDRVAVDEQPRGARLAGVVPADQPDPGVAKEHELAGRPRERAAGIESRHRRHLALDTVWPGVDLDRVPLGVYRTAFGLVGHDEEESSSGRNVAARPLPGPVQGQPA